MTGLHNKHIVSKTVSAVNPAELFYQELQGTLRFNPDIPYWSGNGFMFTFQTQVTFWILGGKNIVLDGGGTLDGAGQVSSRYAIISLSHNKNSGLVRCICVELVATASHNHDIIPSNQCPGSKHQHDQQPGMVQPRQ